MFSILRNRLGIPGVISVVALVFAMMGGAYAASNSGGKATASAKAKQGPRGPKGAKGAKGDTGAPGPQGPAGANGKDGATGPQGAKGDPGAKGTNGTDGTDGTDGTSVTNVAEPTGTGNCEGLGGSKFTVGAGTATFACNGKKGEKGDPGETGFTKTLPPGETETGTISVLFGESEFAVTSISLPIPLENEIPNPKVHTAPDAACTGTASKPTAPAGEACFYPAYNVKTVGALMPSLTQGIGTTGSEVGLQAEEANEIGIVTFAVSAPAGP